jgi:DNA-binding response OmpR family regulator
MNLLIVDDHALFRSGLELLLAREASLVDVRVAHAGCLSEALEVLERGLPTDMVLLDLGLPDCEGIVGLVRLREEHPDLPVVVLGGRSEKNDPVCRRSWGGWFHSEDGPARRDGRGALFDRCRRRLSARVRAGRGRCPWFAQA